MVTRIYTPPVMSYYRAQQQQSLEEEQEQQAVAEQSSQGASQTPVQSQASRQVVEEEAAGQRQHRSAVLEQLNQSQIQMKTILGDFQNTLNALGADEQTQQEVKAYLGVVSIQASKEKPDVGYIRHTLKTAAGTMDGFISDTLKQPSNVVRDWVDALLLQPIDFHLNKQEQASVDTSLFQLQKMPQKTVSASLIDQDMQNADMTQYSILKNELSAQVKEALSNSKAQFKSGDVQAANATLQSALQQLDGQDLPGLSGRVYSQLGKIAKEYHQYDKAKNYFNQAINAFQSESGNPKYELKQAQAYLGLGEVLERQGQWPEAAATYRNALDMADGSPKTLFAAQNGLGNVLLQQGEHAKALDQFLSAYQVAQKTPELAQVLPDTLSNIGAVYQRQTNFQKSEQAYRLALKYAKKDGALDSYRATLQQLASLYDESHQEDRYDKVMQRLSGLPL